MNLTNPVNFSANFAEPLPNKKRLIKTAEKFDTAIRKTTINQQQQNQHDLIVVPPAPRLVNMQSEPVAPTSHKIVDEQSE